MFNQIMSNEKLLIWLQSNPIEYGFWYWKLLFILLKFFFVIFWQIAGKHETEIKIWMVWKRAGALKSSRLLVWL